MRRFSSVPAFERAAAIIAQALTMDPEKAARFVWLEYRRETVDFREEVVLALTYGLVKTRREIEARANCGQDDAAIPAVLNDLAAGVPL